MQSFKRGVIYSAKTDVLANLQGGLGASVRSMADAFSRARKQIDLGNPDQAARSRIAMAVYDAAKEDVREIVEAEKAMVEAAMAAERRKYERAAELNRDKLAQEAASYQRRVDAFTAEELKKEAILVMSGKRELTPDMVDIISAAAKATNPHLHADLRKTVQERDLYSPWKHTDDGKVITKYLNTIDAALRHGNEIPVLDANGRSYNVTLAMVVENIDSLGGDL